MVEKWKNPYLQEDIALDMFITSPSGKALTLPCYFESGESGKESVWKARFSPQETGHLKTSLLKLTVYRLLGLNVARNYLFICLTRQTLPSAPTSQLTYQEIHNISFRVSQLKPGNIKI